MKAHLLYPDRDFDLNAPLPWNAEALAKDLALSTLFETMAGNDKLIFEVSRKVILCNEAVSVGSILYRQENLRDCLNNPAVLREIYGLAVDAVEQERRHYLGVLARYPNWVLRSSVEFMEVFAGFLRKLRNIADGNAARFVSDGWTTLFATLQTELSDEYFERIDSAIEQLKFRNGILLSAELGKLNKGEHYTLHRLPRSTRRGLEWLKSLFAPRSDVLCFTLHPRDESGARALAEIRDRGISSVATSLAESVDHVRSFFDMLRTELAFYVGCVNLTERLTQRGYATCFPVPVAADEHRLSFRELRDVNLALKIEQAVVPNDIEADARELILVTGANQGGKSTFLRSIGTAQLMMQSGMPVAAASFRANICERLFTHYKREEDVRMRSGKLDEELNRMSDIIDHITPNSLILLNESFAATNEREGSEIARQILSALADNHVKVICVTHLYELAESFYEQNRKDALFLRADRHAGGARTFKLMPGAPLQTSFGEDLYNKIFAGETARWNAKDQKENMKSA